MKLTLKNICKKIKHSSDKRRFKKLKHRAELANSSAYIDLAECYYNGIGTRRNYKAALKCYIKAAESGDAKAQYELGKQYWEGGILVGREKNETEARRWLQLARESSREARDFIEEIVDPQISVEAMEETIETDWDAELNGNKSWDNVKSEIDKAFETNDFEELESLACLYEDSDIYESDIYKYISLRIKKRVQYEYHNRLWEKSTPASDYAFFLECDNEFGEDYETKDLALYLNFRKAVDEDDLDEALSLFSSLDGEWGYYESAMDNIFNPISNAPIEKRVEWLEKYGDDDSLHDLFIFPHNDEYDFYYQAGLELEKSRNMEAAVHCYKKAAEINGYEGEAQERLNELYL